MSSIASELVKWAGGRPGWQRRVLSRLAQGETLGAADHRAIAERLAAGDDDPQATFALAAATEHETSGAVGLVEIAETANVNALAAGETLTFAPKGLTVVYGDNGSGKSGYARLIKQISRARVIEPVLPDIFTTSTDHPPRAEITISLHGQEDIRCQWPEAPRAATQIGFFDESCGEAFLTKESEVTYRPAELNLFDGLSRACDGVRNELDRLLSENANRATPLPSVSPEGQAARFLRELSPSTTDDEIARACRVAVDVDVEIEALERQAHALQASGPARERERLEGFASHFDVLANHLASLDKRLGREAITALAEKKEKAEQLRAAATIAAQASSGDQPVAGVGSETWRALWKAARSFSETDAYPGDTFPHLGADSKCVLCHQDLSDEAQVRMRRFETVVQDRTEQQAQAAERDATAAETQVRSTVIEPNDVAVAFERVQRIDQTLTLQSREQITAFQNVVREVERGNLTDALDAVPGNSQANGLRAEADRARASAAQIDETAYERQLRDIKAQIGEKQDSRLMADAHGAILSEVARLTKRDRLETAKGRTRTNAITSEATRLTREYVTSEVQRCFAKEAGNLLLGRVILEDTGGQKGQLTNKPALDGAKRPHQMDNVLSEGEQTALGLAGFFTDTTLDRSNSAIVLDDPVSSLDHRRRARVAARLADFALTRQVIIFTHDHTFVNALALEADKHRVEITKRTVERKGGTTPGACSDGHPWATKDTKARLGQLTQDLAQLKSARRTLTGEEYERQASEWAGKLSETWERAIRELVVEKVFPLMHMELRPKMFRLLVHVSEEDDRTFQASYRKVSGWLRRHDKTPAVNQTAPDLDELAEELETLKKWRDRVLKYSQGG